MIEALMSMCARRYRRRGERSRAMRASPRPSVDSAGEVPE
jgi:hypothetical protein